MITITLAGGGVVPGAAPGGLPAGLEADPVVDEEGGDADDQVEEDPGRGASDQEPVDVAEGGEAGGDGADHNAGQERGVGLVESHAEPAEEEASLYKMLHLKETFH